MIKRRAWKGLLGGCALAFSLVVPGAAQENATASQTGTVSGRVTFADTNGPARFSKVLLKSTVPADAKDDMFSELMSSAASRKGAPKLSAEDEAERRKQLAAASKMMAAVSDMLVSTTVGSDGAYVFTNVKAGSYYVHANAPGYIDPLAQFSADDLASKDPAIRAKIAAASTVISVTGRDAAHADLRLERGASISGRVLYDDGTPAVGWTVRPVYATSGTSNPDVVSMGIRGVDVGDIDLAHAAEMVQTDDQGHYRIAGLPTGSYVVQARLLASAIGHSGFNPIPSNNSSPFAGGMASMMSIKLTVFSGNALRRADAVPVSVRAGEERAGYDLTMPLHTLHTLTGMVRAKTDGHAVNGGSVELILLDEQGHEDASVHVVTAIGADGNFRFDYLPGPATYSLKAAHVVDQTTTGTTKLMGSTIAEQKTSRSYGSATTTVVLGEGDVSDAKLDVPDAAVTK